MTGIRSDFSLQALGQGLLVALVGSASSVAIVIQGLTAVGASVGQIASALVAVGISMGLVAIVSSWVTRMPISIAWTTPGLALLATLAWGRRRSLLWVILGIMALGGSLEIIQSLVGRDGEWGDFFANDLGALLGLAVAAAYLSVPRRLVDRARRD